jgi:hypothetical protein
MIYFQGRKKANRWRGSRSGAEPRGPEDCEEGYEFVREHSEKDGTFVHAYCRRIDRKEKGDVNIFVNSHDETDHRQNQQNRRYRIGGRRPTLENKEPGKLQKLSPTRIAVILQGPTGSGKTATIGALLKGFERSVAINLDDGWKSGEKRSNPSTRYDDIRSKNGETVLIEHFCGNEAMSSPDEWVRILEQKQYEIYVFRLKPSLSAIMERCKDDHKANLEINYARYYGSLADDLCAQSIRGFSGNSGLEPELIENDSFTADEVASYIHMTVQMTSQKW